MLKKEYMESNPPILIVGKDNCYFPSSTFIKGRVRMGNYCAIGENLRIIANNHNYHLPAMQANFYMKHFRHYPGPKDPPGVVTIGSDVWFGDNVTILKSVNIGHGAVIGACAVVTKDIPPYAIAVGVPAKVVGYRFRQDIIDFLLDLKWWDWPEDKIRRNKAFFNTDLSEMGLSIEDIKLVD